MATVTKSFTVNSNDIRTVNIGEGRRISNPQVRFHGRTVTSQPFRYDQIQTTKQSFDERNGDTLPWEITQTWPTSNRDFGYEGYTELEIRLHADEDAADPWAAGVVNADWEWGNVGNTNITDSTLYFGNPWGKLDFSFDPSWMGTKDYILSLFDIGTHGGDYVALDLEIKQLVGGRVNQTRKLRDPRIIIDETGQTVQWNGSNLGTGDTSSWLNITSLEGYEGDSFDFRFYSNGVTTNIDMDIRWDEEFTQPTSLATLRVYDHGSGTTLDVPLVDQNDPALDYNLLRAYHHGDGLVYAVDLVDPSDPNASDLKIYHPTQGILAVRDQI